MPKTATHPADGSNAGFRERLEDAGVSPLWDVMAKLVTDEPKPEEQTVGWSYEAVRPLLIEAGAVVSAEQAERRVLILGNPGLPEARRVTNSLYAGLQLVLPGEIAPVHRHSQSALRFILESSGAYTAVDGEQVVMSPFDLVLTPSMRWHEHGNETNDPAIWLDGLDIPTVLHFNSGFAEREPHEDAPIAFVPAGDSMKRYGRNLRPKAGSTADRSIRNHPLFHYPYAQWREALEDTARHSPPDPHFGCRMEFTNPYTAGSVLPTISAFVQRIPAGMSTKRVWSTDGTVWVCVEGGGRMLVSDTQYDLKPRDIIVAPSWQPVNFEATSELVLFAYSDKAAQERLDLWQERRE
ncbi:gentisate 1,2-dioxygenase [Sinorhizobium meliloti]|nr:gentisate 1,2-dioxygenase [Sinorhizobium meliloti]